jgi:hypothetical protein
MVKGAGSDRPLRLIVAAPGVIWFGGWTALTVLSVIRDFVEGGPALVSYWLGPALLLWAVFVAIPLVGARLIRGSRPRYRALVED